MLPRLLLITLFLSSWSGLAIQLGILISNTPENGMTVWTAIAHFLRFFTIWSNILVAVCSSVLLFSARGSFFTRPAALSAVAVYIFVVGIVYNLLLRGLWVPEGRQLLADNLLHVIVPVLYLVYWWIAVNKQGLTWGHAFRWLLLPAVYLVYALLRGAFEGIYPYPFIDAGALGYRRASINAAGMLIVFVVVGLLLVALGRWQVRKAAIS